METKLNLESQTIDALQELIRANIDSHEVLQEAAESVDHDAMKTLFRRISESRSDHAEELQRFVQLNGEEPTDDGSAKGSARKLWMKVRAGINAGDPKAVLVNAESAEDVIKDKYETLLIETAGSAMNDVLMRQFRDVKRHHDLVRDLRDHELENATLH